MIKNTSSCMKLIVWILSCYSFQWLSGFSLAMQYDHEIFNEAFENNIVIVSTSTLLATLRTIVNIWKLEYQNKNAIEIARQSGALYDKFVGLIVDFDKIGDSIESSHRSRNRQKTNFHQVEVTWLLQCKN